MCYTQSVDIVPCLAEQDMRQVYDFDRLGYSSDDVVFTTFVEALNGHDHLDEWESTSLED